MKALINKYADNMETGTAEINKQKCNCMLQKICPARKFQTHWKNKW